MHSQVLVCYTINITVVDRRAYGHWVTRMRALIPSKSRFVYASHVAGRLGAIGILHLFYRDIQSHHAKLLRYNTAQPA